MIAKREHYNVTLVAIARFEAALARADATNAHLPPAIQATMKASVVDRLEELRREAAEYEAEDGLIQ